MFYSRPPQLYNEVQARRGGSDIAPDKQTNGDALGFGPGHASRNGFFDGAKGDRPVTAATTPTHSSGGGNGFGCGYGTDGYGYAAGHRNGGYGYGCHGNEGVASEIGDLLQDYLGQGKDMKRRNNGARRVVSARTPHPQFRTLIPVVPLPPSLPPPRPKLSSLSSVRHVSSE